MELKNQVVSLQLAKRLNELGAKQDSYFSWVDWGNVGEYRVFHGDIRCGEPITRIAAAVTVAELGEMLPYDKDWMPTRLTSTGEWVIVHGSQLLGGASMEADARAKMLIYLLENDLIR